VRVSIEQEEEASHTHIQLFNLSKQNENGFSINAHCACIFLAGDFDGSGLFKQQQKQQQQQAVGAKLKS